MSSCYIQEELGPPGRNQQNFRKLRVEKATSGYLGVWIWACNSSHQPAVPTEVALWALLKAAVAVQQSETLACLQLAQSVCYGQSGHVGKER